MGWMGYAFGGEGRDIGEIETFVLIYLAMEYAIPYSLGITIVVSSAFDPRGPVYLRKLTVARKNCPRPSAI